MSLVGRFRIRVNAAQAKPSPAIGQTLGPLGINMMMFCKEFNARTANVQPHVPLQVTLQAYSDRTFKFSVRPPESSWFLRRAARLAVGTGTARHQVVGNVRLKELYHIARAKSMDPPLIGRSLHAICSELIGTCHNMGVKATRDLQEQFTKRDFLPVSQLVKLKENQRALNRIRRRTQMAAARKK